MNYCILRWKQVSKQGSAEETNGTGLVFKAKIITHIIHDFSTFCFSADIVLYDGVALNQSSDQSRL